MGQASALAPAPPPSLVAGPPRLRWPRTCSAPSPCPCRAVKQGGSTSAARATPSQRRNLVPGPVDADSEAELMSPRENRPARGVVSVEDTSSGPAASAAPTGAGNGVRTETSTESTTWASNGASTGSGTWASNGASSRTSTCTSDGPGAGWRREGGGSGGTILFAEAEREAPARRFRFRNGREILEERAFLVGVQVRGQSPPQQSPPQQGTKGRGNRKGGRDRSSPADTDSRRGSAKEGSAEESDGVRQSAEVGAEFPVEESLAELARLCDTAGLQVLGSTFQR